MTHAQIYKRDIEWLKQADLVVAEISIPSLGIGYELATAESLGKKIICFYDNNSEKSLSAMIGGNPNLTVIKYDDVEEVIKYLDPLK